MQNNFNVLSVNISEKKGTIKVPVPSIELTSHGVTGDAHSGPWNRQVSLLGAESVQKFEGQANRTIIPGEFAENITTEGIELWKTNPLDRFISETVELEVTQIGKECHGTSCAIFKEVGNCVMPKEGIFARVIKPGVLKAGDQFRYQPKVFSVHVITLSDRASDGVYQDKSGRLIQDRLTQFFENSSMQASFFYSLIPDDPQKLHHLVQEGIGQSVDLIITSGGTGIGPRDITPETIRPLIEKEIPGIMEMIRVKYGAEKPNALLSRSMAGVTKKTLILTLPGSPKAVNEYLTEIEKSLKHLFMMIHGIDFHG